MDLIKILVICSILSLIPGQIVRIPIFGSSGAITPTDFFVFAAVIFYVLNSLLIKKSFLLEKKFFLPALIFSLFALTSTILAKSNFTFSQILISSLFLIRFILYFTFSFVVAQIVKKGKVESWLNLLITVGTVFVLLGFIQLFTYSDLTLLVRYGWDPHQNRIVSTLLDPNFTGGIFALITTVAFSLYLFKHNKIYLFAAIFAFVGIIFTFSRSTYLATVAAFIVIAILRSPKILLFALILFLLSFIFLPYFRDRIVGAATIDETAQARIESWQKALTIFSDHPILGVGFNTYRYAQEQYGFFNINEPQGGHSGAGSDSSILLVAATTGITGFVSYLVFLGSILSSFLKRVRNSPLFLASTAIFFALLVHSQFVNSLFFPQIMLILFFMLGLTIAYDR